MTKAVQIKDQNFILHASGALFWEEELLLIISDVHLGKVSHFRKFGSALPRRAAEGNFRKLDEVLAFFVPQKICFLGDLFHSSINQEWRLFEKWLSSVAVPVVLVEGNHDIISPLKYEELGVEVIPELLIKSFFLTHHPEEREGWFNFSGHLHPGIRLSGPGRQVLKLPCFFQRGDQMILPAFGEFTGNYLLTPEESDKVYVITGERVFSIS